VRFLCNEGVKPIEIHCRMIMKYGDRCMSCTQMYEWTEKFKNGVTSVEDSRPGPELTEERQHCSRGESDTGEPARQSRRWQHYWTLVLDQPITSFMMS
jgi:hypothetical protein